MTLSFLAKSNFSIPAKPRSPSWLRVQILATPETRKKDPNPHFQWRASLLLLEYSLSSLPFVLNVHSFIDSMPSSSFIHFYIHSSLSVPLSTPLYSFYIPPFTFPLYL